MPLGIDPKVDFAFKLVFGSPDHTSVTIHFLNSVLSLPEPIVDVEILNPIQGKDRSDDKLVVLDVLATDSSGRCFNIEMQTTIPLDLPQRLTYYGSLNLARQISEGDAYLALRPSISICVLSRKLFPQIPGYHLSFRLRCDQADLVFSDALEFHTLELEKFAEVCDNVETKSLLPVEKWLYFLQHAEHLDVGELRDRLPGPAFREAVGVLEMISRTPQERHYYEARLKFQRDQQANMMAARLEGREEGHRAAMVSTVRMLEDLMGESLSDESVLEERSTAELHERVDQLREQIRKRQS